jgi:hypothetical protein
MSSFNPDQFLDMQVSESNDTKVIPVPAGEWNAVIEGVKVRPWQAKNDSSNAGLALDLQWGISDPAVLEAVQRDKATVKQGIMLDLTEGGGLDMGKGKNVSLGRLREAIGLNEPGKPFSFSMLVGRMAKVNVTHRVVGEDIFADVKGVIKYS